MKRNFSVCLTVFVAVAFVCMYAVSPYVGDDLAYQSVVRKFDGWNEYWGPGRFHVWIAFHWVHVNGRMANVLAAFLLGFLPKMLNALLMGLAVGAMTAFVLEAAGLWRRVGRQCAAAVVVAFIVFIMPWWDSMFLYDCCLNYVWASALPLSFVWALHRPFSSGKGGRYGWLVDVGLCLWAFIAGAMHEAATVPLLLGLVWWLAHSGRWTAMTCRRKMMIYSFAAGVCYCLFSIGIWRRFGRDAEPNDPLLLLLLKSVPVTLLLLLFICSEMLHRCGRERVRAHCSDDVGLWVVAAFGSMAFCAVGGIVGRSGWFSQLYALIAIILWLEPYALKIPWRVAGSVAGLLSVAVVCYCLTLIPRLRRAGDAEREMRELYADAPDGIVFYDMPRSVDEPWWTLGRVRILDADDSWSRVGLATFYRRPLPVVLPVSARSVLYSKTSPFVSEVSQKKVIPLSNGDFISSSLPEGAEEIPVWTGFPSVYYFPGSDGRQWVAVPFTVSGLVVYHLTPRIIDLGDR